MKTPCIVKNLILVLLVELCLASDACAFDAAEAGRWINRDPIGEAGGIDLYGFTDNSPVSEFDPLGLLPPSNPTCQALKRKIANLEKEVQDRTRELYEDPLGLPGKVAGDDVKPSLSKRGHQRLLNMMKANLAAKRALYQASCNDPEPPPSCPFIQPMFTGQPESLSQAAMGIGAAAIVVGAAAGGPVVVGNGGLVLAIP